MKRNTFLPSLFFGFYLFLVPPTQAFVPESFTLRGDVSMVSLVSQKPSSVNQRSAFQSPEGRLGAEWSFDQDAALVAALQYGKTRDSVNGRYNLQVDLAYFQFKSLFIENHWLKYGLIPHPWEDLTERFWGHRYLGARGPTFAIRNGYLNHADLGLISGFNLEPWGSLSLMIVNGEGAGVDEPGPRKDFHFTVEAQPFENFRDQQRVTLALLLVQGAYDNIDAEISQKERIAILLGFEQDLGWMGSLELMSSKDPVDGINLLLADKVDLAAQGGQVAKGQGGSLILKYRLHAGPADKPFELFGRVDQWNPALAVGAKGMRSQLLGIGFFPRQHLQFSLAWSEVLYENNHAANPRDSADLLLAARLKW